MKIPLTCGECDYSKEVTQIGGHHPGAWITCSHELAARVGIKEGWAVDPYSTPPEWCPLRSEEAL